MLHRLVAARKRKTRRLRLCRRTFGEEHDGGLFHYLSIVIHSGEYLEHLVGSGFVYEEKEQHGFRSPGFANTVSHIHILTVYIDLGY